jgi:hypothetical protein
MKATPDQQSKFLARRPLPGVRFGHDDVVRISKGEQSGQTGNLISIEEIGDDPLFLVELTSGDDILVHQSQLQLAGG